MEFDSTQGGFDLSFGVVGTQVDEEIAQGASSLFATESKPLEEQPQPIVKEEAPKEDIINFEPIKSGIFEQKEEAEVEETPKIEEKVEQPVETPEEPTGEVDYSVIYKTLVDQGVLSEDEEETEVANGETLLEQFRKEGRKIANEEISGVLGQAGPGAWEAFKAVIFDKVDPELYFKSQATIERYQNLDIEDEQNQEIIVRNYYKSLGWQDDKISKKLTKLKDYDDLKDEAEVAQEKLVELEQLNIQQVQAQKQQELQYKKQQKDFYEQEMYKIAQSKLKTKDFDGIPVTEKIANNTLNYITQPAYQIPATGEVISAFDNMLLELKKPENFEKAFKIALLEQAGWDFSKIKSKALSEKSNELFKSAMQKEKVVARTTSEAKIFSF